MAQRRYRSRRGSNLAKRLGLTGGRAATTALLAVACAAGGVGAWREARENSLFIERSATPETSENEEKATGEVLEGDGVTEEATTYLVHVDGAVVAPGVVRLEGRDLRVCDAVEAAGGLVEGADTSSINLAEPLSDGSKIHIPFEGEETAESVAVSPGQSMTSGATGQGEMTVLVNINTATNEELQSLPGVGEATARAIVEDRAANGPFVVIEDLMRVSGIGEKKFARLRSSICV